jgi:serine/threonine protein kinase
VATLKDLRGQTLGQYTIIEQIGAGGMATVFRAHQPSLNRNVALKILPPQIAEKEGFTERFEREAQAIGNLHHPNILPVYDFGEDKGYGYIAMRYVPNAKTLGDWMKSQLAEKQILEFIRQIASALDYAHQAGIVHRDVKPSNILMDGEWVLLSDFGLAKLMASPSQLTGTGAGIGTPAYMSPEQAQGEAVDHRTDIYALGIILFEMLTGQIPHKAETPLATVVKRISEPAPSPRLLNPDIPHAVESVLLKVLAVKPAERFNRADDFAQALYDAFAAPPSYGLSGATLSVPKPLSLSNKQENPALPISSPVLTPSQPEGRHTAEVIAMTLLGVVALCALGGILLSLMTESNGQISNLAMASSCFGLLFASLSSIGLIWFRKQQSFTSGWLALGLVSWFVGVSLLGLGGFALLSPGEGRSFTENAGFTVLFCFAPGGILALLGLVLYGYARRQPTSSVSLAQASLTSQPPLQNDKLRRAEEYRQHILHLIEQKRGTPLADQLALIPPKLDLWQVHLQQLVKRLQSLETNSLLRRDLREVPDAINRLQAELMAESNPHLRAQMAETLAGHQEHQRQLKSLMDLLHRTELEIEETLANIGAIYSQLQMLEFKDIDNSRAKRLSADIDEQAARLGDLLAAMDEVYVDKLG